MINSLLITQMTRNINVLFISSASDWVSDFELIIFGFQNIFISNYLLGPQYTNQEIIHILRAYVYEWSLIHCDWVRVFVFKI